MRLSKEEIGAYQWLSTLGRPMKPHETVSHLKKPLASLCRKGVAKVRFVGGDFYYELKREHDNR